MARRILLSVCAALVLCGTGCATTDEAPAPTAPGVSNIPWNRPERWEGSAGIPGLPSPGMY